MLKITAIYDESPERTLVLCDPSKGDKVRLRPHRREFVVQERLNLRATHRAFSGRANRTGDLSIEVTHSKESRAPGVRFYFDHPDQANGIVAQLIFAEPGFIRVLANCVINATTVDPYNVTNTTTYTVTGGEILTAIPE